MDFKKLTICKWQQFDNAEIIFHNRLTILTGANGSGKTTILNLLARHCGWSANSLATPEMDTGSKAWKWIAGWFFKENQYIIGNIEYSDGAKANLVVPQQNSARYQVSIQNARNVECLFIPEHRSVFRYQPVDQLPTQNTTDKKQAFDKVSSSNKQTYFGGRDNHSSSYYMKETLILWNIFGYGNQIMEPEQKLLEYFRSFEEILKIVLPKELGFKRFVIRKLELVFECDSGNFIIDAASGGISTIIDMAWQIYMYSTDTNKTFTVLIDEVENHLHPTMQRKILPDFVKAFPNVKFIVSTHSPLIVGSVKDSETYVLRYNHLHKVVAEKLDLINKAKTAAEILDEVLGVSFTMPIWVEEKLKEIMAKYADKKISDENIFKNLRSELSEIGLEKFVPEAITNLIIEREKNEKNQ